MPTTKTELATLLLFVLTSLSSTVFAANRYDSITGLVEFACVSVADQAAQDSSAVFYSLTLAPVSDTQFSVASITDTIDSGECAASFDTGLNQLVGEVRVTDLNYSVELQYDESAQTFTLLNAWLLGFAETSLWTVSNGSNELYLGGTIHLLHQRDFPLPIAYSLAFNQAQTVVFETDPGIIDTPSNLGDIILPEGELFSDYLSESTTEALNDFLSQFDLSVASFGSRRPEFVDFDLFYLGAASFGYGSGVDAFFSYAAQIEEKETGGLELASDQIAAIGASSGDSDIGIDWDLNFATMLAYIETGQLDTDLRQQIAQWREGRTELVATANEELKLFYPDYYESIYTTRNNNWIPVIEAYLESPEVELILGGLGHFAGPDNVLDLLRERGYTIERYVPQTTL